MKKAKVKAVEPPTIKINWRVRQGNTAIVEGIAHALKSEVIPEQEYYVRPLASMNGWLFAQKKNDTLLLWSFGQYDSNVLPEHLHAVFVKMIPENTELVRPEPKKRERTFDDYKR